MERLDKKITAVSNIRMSQKDAHYGGNLVDGAQLLHLIGDVATELSIKHDGDEGLLLKYNYVNFYLPVYSGDYVKVIGELTEKGNTSRKMEFTVYKTVTTRPDINDSAADAIEEPVVVCRAELIGVTKEELKRKNI